MKRIILIITFLLTATAQVCPQPFWQELNFPLGGIVRFIKTNPDGHIFIINQQGFYRSTDNGLNWYSLTLPGNSIDAIAINSKNDIYSGYNFSLYRSTDNGITWNLVGLEGLRITAIGFNSLDHIFVGTEIPDYSTIYRSTDNGLTWTELGLTGSWSNVNLIRINALDIIFVIRNQIPEMGLFASFDNGETWNLQSIFVNFSIDFDTSHNILAGRDQGVFYSTDNGITWIDKNFGLINPFVHSVVINSKDHFFISTSSGVYRSSNQGQIWEEINNGLGNADINLLQISEEGYLFASAFDGRVYRSVSTTTNITNDYPYYPEFYKLSQNYPNPFNPGTKIIWQSPVSSHQVLKVFDVLGREVATLVDEYKDAGFHEVEFNAAGLSSGVYFYRIQAGDYVETRKMVLIR